MKPMSRCLPLASVLTVLFCTQVTLSGCTDKQAATSESKKEQAHASLLEQLSGVWKVPGGETVFISADGVDGMHLITKSESGEPHSVRAKVIGFDAVNKIISLAPKADAKSEEIWTLRPIESKGQDGSTTIHPMFVSASGRGQSAPILVRKLLPADLKDMKETEFSIMSANDEAAAAKAMQDAQDAKEKAAEVVVPDSRCPGVDLSSSVGMIDCAGIVLEAADKALNAEYKRAMSAMSSDAQANLRAAQRVWITKRNEACSEKTLGGGDVTGGTALTINMIGCKTTMTKERTAELAAIK